MDKLDPDSHLVLCVACGDSIVEDESWCHRRRSQKTRWQDDDVDPVCWDCYQNIDYRDRFGVEKTIQEIEERGLEPKEFASRYLNAIEDQNEVL